MPGITSPPIAHYVPAPTTKENLDWAKLAVIDLSKADTLEGRTALAAQVRDAMSNQGFFYVINHGLTEAQSERIFDIADVPFSMVSDEGKRNYVGTMKEAGSYNGYKLRQYNYLDAGVRDQVEHYNLNKDVTLREHPPPLRPFLPEIDKFAQHNHFRVLFPILRLLAIGLELPEDTFVEKHGFKSTSDSFIRFMKFYPRSEEEETKTKNVWFKGHTDFTSISILWSQPVAALQIFYPDEGKWRWIKHMDNALVINAGDTMEFWSRGFYKATIHRVVQPPPDQRGYTRLGVYYFVSPDDDTTLAPYTESPIVQRRPVYTRLDEANPPTAGVYRKGRISAYGQSELKKGENNVEEEMISGVLVKHYN